MRGYLLKSNILRKIPSTSFIHTTTLCTPLTTIQFIRRKQLESLIMNYRSQIEPMWINLSMLSMAGGSIKRPMTSREAYDKVCKAFYQAEDCPLSLEASEDIKAFRAESNIWEYYGKPFLQGYLESIAKPTSRQKQALHGIRSSEYYIINDCILNINYIQFSASEPGKWTPLSIPTKRRGGCNEAEDITQAEGGYSIWLESQDGRAVVCNQVLCTGGISCPMW
jgi:hypothetical protein